ncbi:PAS domain S-box-containing protein [Novosphingobium chloroacetimidivorans]|uniref:histidine kinase n=1 Tax=Novosphingobium chloroacetimidivorans TaxID=1428314 RepID=A0A7W7K7B5_9SPHN|nr:response regulator [Novosphingobium chloroacetimidivorans]MBB4856933.1 PAS domain S-box-containing protein [Novosphingobium chloroacetimidivorans]
MPSDAIKILAVDDVKENLVALEAALDQPGVQLVTVGSGFEALELLLRDDFALALLDVQMPEMDGFELAELMRGTERTRAVPIIFLTAVATDERRKFRGFEAGAVDYLLKPLDIHILNSKVAVFVELARQRREIARQRDELASALGRLRAHDDNSPLAVVELDADLRIVTWAAGAERLFGFGAAQMLGQRLENAPFLPTDDRDGILTAMRALFAGENRREMQEHRFIRADGTLREAEWYCSSLAGSAARQRSAMIQVLDITARHRAEETQRLLIGELNHRVKNTLATVQAIAAQGFRHARNHDEFRDAFTGRIQALARAHSLLSATTWEHASLRGLIADQVAIGAVSIDRLRLEGPRVDLPPELSLRFALVLHELTTNAHKYGALSNENGHVAITWSMDNGLLSFAWSEHGGPAVTEPARKGFGTTLVMSSLAGEDAEIAVDYAPEGVRWRMALPLDPVMRAPAKTPPQPAPAAVSAPLMPGACLPPGLTILVVEDEPLLAMELMTELEEAGALPLGPASSCAQALEMIREEAPDLALLDGNLNGERIDAVADDLAARGIPFAFVSGYGREHLPAGHQHRPVITKPFVAAEICDLAAQLAAQVNPDQRLHVIG